MLPKVPLVENLIFAASNFDDGSHSLSQAVSAIVEYMFFYTTVSVL